jgi:hypothetical protein
MNYSKRVLSVFAALSMLATGCSASQASSTASSTSTATTSAVSVVTNLSKIDNTKWQYNSRRRCILSDWCQLLRDTSLQTHENSTLAVFVPGSYFTGTAEQ